MSDFPKEGRYRITSKGCTATILDDEYDLRGEPISDASFMWDLEYVNGDSGLVMCVLKDVSSKAWLGVYSVENAQPITRFGQEQAWILREAEGNYTISQISGDKEYFWYLSKAGDKIMIADSSTGTQSWAFEGSY